jgi:oligopeptide/dipeptide ABC transporter ATP-binding protein
MTALLEVRGLKVRYRGRGGDFGDWLRRRPPPWVHAVDGVDFDIAAGEIVGLVGESGCGKSSLGRALLRLTPASGGSVRFDGEDLLGLEGEALMRFRRRAQMVFQDPLASLNPRRTLFETLAEVLRVHRLCPESETRARVLALMDQVGLPASLAGRKSHSLSGGQCQRVGIARALAMGADFIVADEPVSALDVSIQAQILNLLVRLQRARNLPILFISHDLGVIRYLCRRVIVMYLGRVVEEGPVEAVFARPRHPYTQSLIDAIPRMAPDARLGASSLTGEPPSPQARPAGCAFHPRCPRVMPQCRTGAPPAPRETDGRQVWCHLYPESAAQSNLRAAGPAAHQQSSIELASD